MYIHRYRARQLVFASGSATVSSVIIWYIYDCVSYLGGPTLFLSLGGVGSSQLATAVAAAHASHDPRLIHTGAKLLYSISVSYHSVIVFYTVDSVMASKRKVSSFFKSETEGKDKQPTTRVQHLEKASFQQAWKLDHPWLFLSHFQHPPWEVLLSLLNIHDVAFSHMWKWF